MGDTADEDRLPDFFIVGHAKSGTTALYEMLGRHPEIYVPEVKEPMFFAREPPAAAAKLSRFEQTGSRTETLEEYTSLFTSAAPSQRVGEASTFYLWSTSAPARIASAQPDAKIIAILREPASFMRSLHLQAVQNRTETETDLRRAVALEDERRAGRSIPPTAHWPRALMYTDRVRYVEQLQRYKDAFAPEQILVLIYEDFRIDNKATVREVLRFLEVDDAVDLEPSEANPSVALRSVRLDRALRSLRAGRTPLSRAVKSTVATVTTARLRREVLRPMRSRLLYGEPPAADEAFLIELRHRFAGEVRALGEYLGRDLTTLWGYDEMD